MKLSRRQLRRLIQEEKKSLDIVTRPFAAAADVGRELKKKWGDKDDKNPEVRDMMSDLWKNSSVSKEQADPDHKDFVGDPKITDKWPWSAATISTMFADDPEFKSSKTGRIGKGSAAHADYMKAAYFHRQKWDKGEDPTGSKKGYDNFVAFKPSEYGGMTGDITCYSRGSGNGWNDIGDENHCDVCLDDGCNQVVGGNISDKLTVRSNPGDASMIITKHPQQAPSVAEERGMTAEGIRKLIRRRIRETILREFKFTGQDFVDNLDLLGGGPPPAEAEESGGGGGSGKVHQLVRVNFDPGSEFNPAAYTKTPIDMTPGSPFSKMREIYNSFSNDTKNKLYQLFPGGIDPESPDSETVWDFRSAYTDLLNTMDAAVPAGRDYEYFVIYHPPYASYGGEDGANELKALDLYRRVTGYTPDANLLNEYELITHSASAMFG
jgi:hypothetical protein